MHFEKKITHSSLDEDLCQYHFVKKYFCGFLGGWGVWFFLVCYFGFGFVSFIFNHGMSVKYLQFPLVPLY